MLKLKELRLSGIGRFVDEQIINFESLGNLIQVDGQNENTGGSSGAGKSTIFNALDYLFGINNTPNTILKSRLTDDGINVQGTFDFDGKPLIITRGKKLKIDIDGEIVVGSSKIAEEKLDEILAIPRELFRPMLHKRQKEGGFFLKMTPKDINDFLTNCLGLSDFKAKIEVVENKIKELNEKKLRASGNVESTSAALKATQDAVLALGPGPTKDVSQATILELKEKMEKSTKEWALLSAQHKLESETLELQRPNISSSHFNRDTLEILEKECADLERNINSINFTEKERQNKAKLEFSRLDAQIAKCTNSISKGDLATKKAAEIAEQIKMIRTGSCYTCNQPWHNTGKEEQLLKELSVYKQEIQGSIIAKQELSELSRKAEELIPNMDARDTAAEILPFARKLYDLNAQLLIERQKEKEHQNTETAKNRKEQSRYIDLQARLKEKHFRESEVVKGQLEIDCRAFESAVNRFKAYEDSRNRHENSLSSLRAQERSYSQKHDTFLLELHSIANELVVAEELKRAMKSYLSCSFDDALETISENATRLIRNIPNMANATIQLEGVRTTQDGKIKEEVNAVIHMDGEENVDIRSLCGGERTSTDLAIDLSVIELIESRANKGIDIFVLDEPFVGLDTVCIEMALEVLKNSNLSKKLIIVDHNPEVKQMVESRLVVVRSGATSKIMQS